MKKRLDGIADLVGKDVVAGINRKPIDDFTLDGFVVGISGKLLCLNIVDGSTLMQNGYAVVRLADIRDFRVNEAAFVDRALRLLKRTPTVPTGIDLSDWPALLASLQPQYPLVTIYKEKEAPGCYPGRVAKMTTKHLDLDYVNTIGHWDGVEKSRFKDITRIGFGDGYAKALATLIAHESGTKRE